jgi:hypothetical protein
MAKDIIVIYAHDYNAKLYLDVGVPIPDDNCVFSETLRLTLLEVFPMRAFLITPFSAHKAGNEDPEGFSTVQ